MYIFLADKTYKSQIKWFLLNLAHFLPLIPHILLTDSQPPPTVRFMSGSFKGFIWYKSCDELFLWNRIWDLGRFWPVGQFRVHEFLVLFWPYLVLFKLCNDRSKKDVVKVYWFKKSVLHDLHSALFNGSLVSADFQANLCLL